MNFAERVNASATGPENYNKLLIAAKSRSDRLVQKSGEVLYLDHYRGTAFKHWFAPAFATYLRDRFANPEQVATAFGVRASTAWNWWNGDSKATGDAVARLFMTFPDAGAWFVHNWESRQ